MACHKKKLRFARFTRRDTKSASSRVRGGSFVIEGVVAVALLATAAIAVVRLARSSADLQLRSDREIAAVLTAQNVLARLDGLGSNRLEPEQIAAVEEACEQASSCDVSISLVPFDGQGVAGTHIQVEVTAGDQVRVELQDWRLSNEPTTEESPDE